MINLLSSSWISWIVFINLSSSSVIQSFFIDYAFLYHRCMCTLDGWKIKFDAVYTYPATIIKKSKRFHVSDKYAPGEPRIPIAVILMNISRAKNRKIKSSNTCNILHCVRMQTSSTHGWYIPNVIQLSRMVIMLIRSNHGLEIMLIHILRMGDVWVKQFKDNFVYSGYGKSLLSLLDSISSSLLLVMAKRLK